MKEQHDPSDFDAGTFDGVPFIDLGTPLENAQRRPFQEDGELAALAEARKEASCPSS